MSHTTHTQTCIKYVHSRVKCHILDTHNWLEPYCHNGLYIWKIRVCVCCVSLFYLLEKSENEL